MPITAATRLRASERVLCKEIGGEAVLLDLETETYFGLNEVGARLWELLSSARSIGEAADALSAEYDVEPSVLSHDVTELAQCLLERGLLRLDHD